MHNEFERYVHEAAIKNLQIRYCRGIDRLDWDLVRSCFHEDAIDDHGRRFRGDIQDFIAWGSSPGSLSRFAATTHFTGNQLVELHGEVAWMESSTRAYHRTFPTSDTPATDWILNLRYVDVVERRHGHWRILDRAIVVDSETTIPVGGDHDQVGPDWHRSARDRTDVSYAAAWVARKRASGGTERLSV
ncbi:nuclear transport factor 2 family protein [Microbacterium lacus]|uniref:nuclear transport factor 2 family protein n=1 Tax=Microbacterium lacus TaxID=415217 RepID=UPI00384C1AC8